MKLIILNGPSGIGKSTVSSRLASEMSNTVVIDVDELRRAIPNYRENRKESQHLAYARAKEEIATHLANGDNVIVDKGIFQSDVLDAFIEEGQKCGADVFEFLLSADKATVQQRADDRGYRPGSLLTQERVGELWEQADKLRLERSNAIVIDTTRLSTEETLEKVRVALGQ
jgi:predicted kinase